MTKDFCDICKKEMEINLKARKIRISHYPDENEIMDYEYYLVCGDCIENVKDMIKEISAID